MVKRLFVIFTDRMVRMSLKLTEQNVEDDGKNTSFSLLRVFLNKLLVTILIYPFFFPSPEIPKFLH